MAPDTDLRWLVDRRNTIQSLLLRLLEIKPQPTRGEWQFLVGAAFSLWRAVFLVHEEDVDGGDNIVEETTEKLLRRVIETNAIGFNDDRTLHAWSGGYYVNNAFLRLGLRTAEAGTGKRATSLRREWDEAFAALEEKVNAVR